MSRRGLQVAVAIAILGAASGARAEPGDAATIEADVLFRAARALRAEGNYPAACVAFAQSKLLAPGVGVSLYLADCDEHVGKNGSAWSEYRAAETLARARNDKRADVARARGAALEPGLARITISFRGGVEPPGAELRIDGGASVASADLTHVAVDPGDHAVTLHLAGRPDRTTTVRVEAGHVATVSFEVPASVVVAPPPPSPRPRVSARFAIPSSPAQPAARETAAPREVAESVILATGIVSLAVGAVLLASKNESMSNMASGDPTVSPGFAAGSKVAFAIGGVALASVVVLYLTAPAKKDTAIVIVPGPVVGGAGAFLRATF